MATRRIQNRPKVVLQAEQKIAFALLVFLGFGGIVFGFRSFGSQLYRPIQLQIAKYYTGQDILGSDVADAKAMEESKKKDTDADGLSDYDELYVYRTSPYLKDSDSDTTDDKTEVFSGTDPNCPVGKNCSSGGEETGASTSPEGILGETSGKEGILATSETQFQSPEEAENFFKSASIQEIRAALLRSGITQAEVDQISDADLQKMFDAAVAQSASEGTFENMTSTPSKTNP